MKAVYMMLSGLILSLGVTVAMAGLLSISSLTKSDTKKNIEVQEQFAGMWGSEENHAHKGLFTNDRYDSTQENETDAYKDCYALESSQAKYKEHTTKKRQSN